MGNFRLQFSDDEHYFFVMYSRKTNPGSVNSTLFHFF